MAANQLGNLVERTSVLKIPVHSLNETDIPEVVQALLSEESLSQIVLLRWWDFMRARADREFRRCVMDASLSLPVSRSIVMGARLLRKRRPPRHMPFAFTIRLLGALEDRHRSIYLLGGSAQSLRTVEQNLRETFPNLRLVGRYTGQFSRAVEADIITAIRKAAPDFIFVGTGVPGSDRWISRHRSEIPGGIALHSSETFDIFADRRQRTSRATFDRGMDFLPDLFRRPWRILRFPVYLWYLVLLFVAKIFRL